MIIYDYIIVGGGPSGCSIAYLLSKNHPNLKIALIDSNDSLGGCHRVDRKNNFFTEHGPRVYSDGYINFINLLKDMNITFDKLFVKYNFTISKIGQHSITKFSIKEMSTLVYQYLKFLINGNFIENISVKEFCIKYNYSETTTDYLDRLCRLTDGTDSSKYSLKKLINLIDDNYFYTLQQPRYSNDLSLFKSIQTALKLKNVHIYLNESVINFNPAYNTISTNKTRYNYSNIIFAIPPRPFFKLCLNAYPSVFKNKIEYYKKMKETDYNVYIPIVFHWNENILDSINKVHGFPINDWGIIFIVISEYNKSEPGTVISCNISILDKKSSFTNKTANESTKKELISEVFRQIQSELNLPKYNKAFIHKSIMYDNGAYINKDTAFINTKLNSKLPELSNNYDNVYSIGTHNGNSNYNFTTLESAVINAIYFYNTQIANCDSDYFPIQKHKKLHHLIYVILMVFVLLIITSLLFK